MKLVRPRYVYCRLFGNNAYLFNRLSWTSVFVKDVLAFKRFFCERVVDVEREARDIARKYAIQQETILADFRVAFDPLIADGYFEVRDWRTDVACQAIDCEGVNSNLAKATLKDANSSDERSEGGTEALHEYLRDHPAPFELCIDLTQSCTERCVHCYVPEFKPVSLDVELVKKVIGEFAAAGGLKVKLTGGECMTHPAFKEILFLATASDMVVSVLSNLTLCDDAMAAYIASCGVAVVQTSLYGARPETHEAITRRKGSFRETVSGIDRLLAHGVPVQINCPVMKVNLVDVDAIRAFAWARNIKVSFDPSIMCRADHDTGNQSYCLDERELERYLRRMVDSEEKVERDVDRQMLVNKSVCGIGISKVCLAASGIYYPCNGCYGYHLGDCREMSIAEVWQSEAMRCLRGLTFGDLDRCRTCENLLYCKVCPSRNFNATGSLVEPDRAACRMATLRRKVCCEGEFVC